MPSPCLLDGIMRGAQRVSLCYCTDRQKGWLLSSTTPRFVVVCAGSSGAPKAENGATNVAGPVDQPVEQVGLN